MGPARADHVAANKETPEMPGQDQVLPDHPKINGFMQRNHVHPWHFTAHNVCI